MQNYATIYNLSSINNNSWLDNNITKLIHTDFQFLVSKGKIKLTSAFFVA